MLNTFIVENYNYSLSSMVDCVCVFVHYLEDRLLKSKKNRFPGNVDPKYCHASNSFHYECFGHNPKCCCFLFIVFFFFACVCIYSVIYLFLERFEWRYRRNFTRIRNQSTNRHNLHVPLLLIKGYFYGNR